MIEERTAVEDRTTAPPARGRLELVGRRVPRDSITSTHNAALAGHRSWLRHLFSYRDTRILVVIFLLTQILDAGTTMYALSTGRFREANPLLGDVIASQPALGYLFKLGVAVFVLAALLLMRLRWRMRRVVILLFALVSLIAPIANILRVTGVL